MSGKVTDRGSGSAKRIAAAALACALAAASPAGAEGLWDSAMETLNLKAAPPAPGPDFVERTRPDPADLGFLPAALPHKVSPLPVKTPAEIKAQTEALDAAAKRQRDPAAAKPLDLVKGRKAAKSTPAAPASAAAVAD